MLFSIHCFDKPGSSALRDANRPAHLDYLKRHEAQIRLAGPTLSDDGQVMNGSLFLIELPNRAAAEAFCAGDPYAKAGVFESTVIRPFKQVLPRTA